MKLKEPGSTFDTMDVEVANLSGQTQMRKKRVRLTERSGDHQIRTIIRFGEMLSYHASGTDLCRLPSHDFCSEGRWLITNST